MSKQLINIGSAANDDTGDNPRAAAQKINANADELYAQSRPKGIHAFVAASSSPDADLADYVCDGTADEVQIQAAIDAASAAGGGVVELSSGSYVLSNSIEPKNNVWLRGQGWSTVLAPAWTASRSAIEGTSFTAGSPLTEFALTDLKIDCVNASASSYTPACKGVFIQYQLRCLFRNLWVKDSYATGIGIDFLVESWIDQCHVTGAGRGQIASPGSSVGGNGIGIGTGAYAVESLLISNCHVSDGYNNGIMFEQQGTPVPNLSSRHMQVVNCIMDGNQVGARVSGSRDVTFSDCRIINSVGTGALVTDDISNSGHVAKWVYFNDCVIDGNSIGVNIEAGSEYVHFTNCNVDRNAADGYRLNETVSTLFVRGGSAKLNGQSGFDILNLQDSEIVDVTVTGNNDANITVQEMVNCRIVGCDFSSSATSRGMYLDGVTGPIYIRDCEFSDNASEGARIRSATDVTLDGCRFARNQETGIYFLASQTRLTATQNRVWNNGQSGSGYPHGVVFQGTGTLAEVIFEGNKCWDDQGTKTQGYGLVLQTTTRNSFLALNNDLRGNDTGALTISSASANDRILGNSGYNPQGPATITVGASPYTYTAGPTPETIYLYGGAVSSVTKAGTQIADATGAQVQLNPYESVVVTYSAAPTMRKDRH